MSRWRFKHNFAVGSISLQLLNIEYKKNLLLNILLVMMRFLYTEFGDYCSWFGLKQASL